MPTSALLVLIGLGAIACGNRGDDTGAGATNGTAEDGGSEEGGSPPTGAELYATHCSACHGSAAGGTGSGPGLERELHHTDEQLVAIILNGKESMDPVDVTEAEAQLIVDFLRGLFGG